MTSFPEGCFYLRVCSANLVLDVERSSFSVKEGSKAVVASQSEVDHDAAFQLWTHDNGYLVNKRANLYLEVDNGKVGNLITLHHQKPGSNGANQRWALTKEGYISLKSHPKYVIDVKGSDVKDVVLADSGSKGFEKSNSAKWKIVPFHSLFDNFLANLKEKPLDNLYNFIALQEPDGSFPPSITLAKFFYYSDPERILGLYKDYVYDERVNNTNNTIWTTSMALWFLRYLFEEHRSEWDGIYERSERYITKELGGDLEIEEIVIASGREAVRERFGIKVVDGKQIITREHVERFDITRMILQQTSNGAFQASDELAKLLSFNSSGQLRTTLTRYVNSQSKNAEITNYETQVWVTILVLYYFRLVGVDYKNEWEEFYLKSYKWLWGQFKGKGKIEQEAFKIIESFVKERYCVKEVVMYLDEQFINYITDKIDFIKKVKKHYGVAQICIINAKNLAKSSLGRTPSPYVKIIGLSSGEVYGKTLEEYSNDPEWNQVFYIPIYNINDKIKLQIWDNGDFFIHVPLGTYVLDLNDFIEVLSNGAVRGKKLDLTCSLKPNKGELRFIADFHSEQDYTTTIISKTTITIQHLYILITYQRPDGGFELNEKLAKLLNYNFKGELVKAFTAYIKKDDDVKALHINTWGTALITAFLKTLLWKHIHEWVTVYIKAETYVSEKVADIETEERLYTLANRFVIERFKVTEWESEAQKKSLGIIVQSEKVIITRCIVSIRHVRRFLSYQRESGCFELDNHLAETLGFNSAEEAKKSLETHFSSYSSYSKVSKLDVNLYSSAIMTWYMRYVLVEYIGEWFDECQSTEKWITEQVKDEQTEEELLKAARRFVEERFDVNDKH